MNNLLISIDELQRLNDKEFDLICSMYSKPYEHLASEEFEPKYYIGKEEKYDDTPLGMEACWVEHSGTLIYFVNQDNILCQKNEHEIGIDFFKEYNICVYRGFVWASNTSKEKHHLTNFTPSDNIPQCFKKEELEDFVLAHKRSLKLELNWDYWLYQYGCFEDEFRIFSKLIKERNINFQIYSSKTSHNKYLLRANDYFCFYSLPKNHNLNNQKMFDLMIEQNHNSASEPIVKEISDLAGRLYKEELNERARQDEMAEKNFYSYLEYLHSIGEQYYYFIPSMTIWDYCYSNFHEFCRKNNIIPYDDFTDENKKVFKEIALTMFENSQDEIANYARQKESKTS